MMEEVCMSDVPEPVDPWPPPPLVLRCFFSFFLAPTVTRGARVGTSSTVVWKRLRSKVISTVQS